MKEIKRLVIDGETYIITDEGAVAFDAEQSLTEDQKAQARANIGVTEGDTAGLTDTARVLLMTVLRNGVYTSDQSANLAALEEALKTSGGGSDEPDVPDEPDTPDVPDVPDEPKTFTVTNHLTNCANSNSATSITANSAYAAVITAAAGYELQSVVATMGGSAVAVTNGVISISAVTGNIVITAVATAVATETVEEKLTPTDIVGSYPNITTFEYTPEDPNYSDGGSEVLFQPSTLGGGVLHVDIDTAEVSKIQFMVYIFDPSGAPYQILKGTTISGGHLDNPTMVSPGTTPGHSSATGSFTMDIPDGCNVMVRCAMQTLSTTSTLNNGYGFKREVLAGNVVTAKVVKEV